MYQAFIDLLNNNETFQDVNIRNIHGTCCFESSFTVRNFDYFKIVACNKLALPQPSSVRAAFVVNNCIYFVLFKTYALSGIGTDTSQLDYGTFTDSINQSNINEKILNSLNLFCKFIYGTDFDSLEPEVKATLINSKIKTIILTDMNDADWLKFRISNLSNLRIFSNHQVLGETLILNCNEFRRMFQ